MTGTDRTKPSLDTQGPVIVLVAPQLAENIGMAARAMANFGLTELRLVAPRDGWPPKHNADKALASQDNGAHQAASGATHVLDHAKVFATLPEAIADLNVVYATTARERGQMKQVFTPAELMPVLPQRLGAGERVGILFGRERVGLENDEISLADAILTFPVNPAFASLNLAQAVLLVGYEWFKAATGGEAPFRDMTRTIPAKREAVISLFDYLENELAAVDFFPLNKRAHMSLNLRDIFHRLSMSEQDVRTLRGAFSALVAGRRGGQNAPRPARRSIVGYLGKKDNDEV
jgi:tRNA/rRNA methyltransferase